MGRLCPLTGWDQVLGFPAMTVTVPGTKEAGVISMSSWLFGARLVVPEMVKGGAGFLVTDRVNGDVGVLDGEFHGGVEVVDVGGVKHLDQGVCRLGSLKPVRAFDDEGTLRAAICGGDGKDDLVTAGDLDDAEFSVVHGVFYDDVVLA